MIVVVIVAKHVSLGQIALNIFVKLGRNKLPTFTKYEMKKIIRLFFSNIFPGRQQLAVGLYIPLHYNSMPFEKKKRFVRTFRKGL